MIGWSQTQHSKTDCWFHAALTNHNSAYYCWHGASLTERFHWLGLTFGLKRSQVTEIHALLFITYNVLLCVRRFKVHPDSVILTLVRSISVSVSLKTAFVLRSLTLHPSDIILKYKHFFLPTDLSTVKTTDNKDNNLKMLKKSLYSETKHIIKQEKLPFPTSRCCLKAAAESSSSRVTTKIKIFPLRSLLCSSSFFILHFQSSLLTRPYVHHNPSYQLHVSHFQN